MKIALVNISAHRGAGKGNSAPLGLAYIGTVIRGLGHEVKGYDLCVNKDAIKKYYLNADEDFVRSIGEFAPDFIGMSCTTTNRMNVGFWGEVFKSRLPDVKIIVGGPHPFFLPDGYLKTYPVVDVLVLGEGERTIAEYLMAYSNGNDLKEVKGIAFRDHDGKVTVNPCREVIDDIDSIAFPARDLFPMEEYDIRFGTITGAAATIITSRGCGNLCKFCSTTNYWKKVRFRSAKNVADEIEDVMNTFSFIRNFIFFDDTFTSNKRHCTSICEEIIQRDLNINWACWSRTNIIDHKHFELLKKAGCTTLSYGIESGNDQMLKVIRKNSTKENNYKALTLGRKYGIHTRGTMIAGMPEEKFSWALDSIFFMVNSGVGPEDLQMSLQTFIFPGTYWEKWFCERYRDFSWSEVPSRFKKGSITDKNGNISLPCYRWGGISFFILWVLLRMITKGRVTRRILSNKSVQKTLKKICRIFPEYPKSVYDG